MADKYDDTPSEGVPPAPVKKTRKSTGKMTDEQKAKLTKHMTKMGKAGMSASEMKSHRMKMMVRMRKGMTVAKAHNDLKKASK